MILATHAIQEANKPSEVTMQPPTATKCAVLL
jgi:hypothetical protein